MIKRRDKVGIIDSSSDEFRDDDEVRYCPHCLDYGFKEKLRPRIYPANEPVPSDADNWKMCHECGSIYPVFELEKESQIKDVVETTDNPFDSGKSFLGIDSRKLRMKKRKQKDSFDYIEDDDVKRELKKGHTLLSYSEEIPQ